MKTLNTLACIGMITIVCLTVKTVTSIYDVIYGPIKLKSYVRPKKKEEVS